MDGFHRDISLQLKKNDDNEIIVNSTMIDRFHHILLEVKLDFDTLVIKDIRVDFSKSPTLGCSKVAERLKLLINTSVSKGLSKKLYQVLGGSHGCINLRNMLLCSLPLAINVQASEGIDEGKEKVDHIHENLIGTCVGFEKPSKLIN